MIECLAFFTSGLVFLGFSIRNGPLRFERWIDASGQQRRGGGWDTVLFLLMATAGFVSFLKR